MKTVVENNKDLYRHLYERPEPIHPFLHEQSTSTKERGFYDFGARSLVEYRGFVNNGDSSFIEEIGECFRGE